MVLRKYIRALNMSTEGRYRNTALAVRLEHAVWVRKKFVVQGKEG